jgi:hypothetical protein
MSQHDYVIANDSGASVRADINSALQAILSQNSGTSEPSSTSAGTLWLDTTGGAPYTLKIRDAGNNHWITLTSVNDPGSDSNAFLPAQINLPTSGGVFESDGSTEILTESSGAVTLKNVTIDTNVTMPVGSVVQVKNTVLSASNAFTSNTSYIATGLIVSITPKFSNSLMIINWESGTTHWNANNGNSQGAFAIYNGTSLVTGSERQLYWKMTGTTNHYGYQNVSSHTSEILSGASTSTVINYELRVKALANTFYYFEDAPATYRPTMTVYEVKQ